MYARFAISLLISLLLHSYFVTDTILAFPKRLLEVHFIDVGQGDSIYIKTPENKHLLIDGGPPESGKIVVDYLKNEDVQTLDILIATHPHFDHIGGLIDVLEQIPIKRIVHSGIVHPTKTYFLYMYQIWKQSIPTYIPSKDEKIFKEEQLTLEVLNRELEYDSINDNSFVLRLTYENLTLLLLGDIERKGEEHLKASKDLEADIIKIAHHGSNTSSSFDFLNEINPQVAIITYDRDNTYGHPSTRVIDNIRFLDTFIYSTATFGDIVVRMKDGQFFIESTSNPLERALMD